MNETRSTLLKRLSDPKDEASWGEFVSLYQPLLLRYVLSQGLNREDAADVVQNVFASLVRTMVDFRLNRTKGRFRTWLWRVAHNALIDWARRQNRQEDLKEQLAGQVHAAQPEPDWDRAYQERIMEYSIGQVRALAQPKTWACFQRHILDGRPAIEVAEGLDMKPGAVYVNASRVLEKVRQCCVEYGDDED